MLMKKCCVPVVLAICLLTVLLGWVPMPAMANQRTVDQKTPSGIALEDLEEEIDRYVAETIGQTTPGAAIAVVKDGQVILSKGYGYADLQKKIPVEPGKTVFEWASTSKLFTWTAVMQLVEEGKLDLDENIALYLSSEFVDALNYSQPITLRDIMNHAAGFGDYPFNTIVFSPDQLVSLEEALLRDQPQQYIQVGSGSAYSNYASSLAGFVVESVSQRPIEEYMRERIFNRISMNSTTAYSTLEDKPELAGNKATGYIPDQLGGFVPGKWSYVSHRPAGSMNGTVEDFAAFAIALTPENVGNSPLFNDGDTLRTMLSPSYDATGGMVGTAHGFFEYVGALRTFGHGGNTATFSSQFAIVPQERFGVVILTNASSEMQLLFGLQDLLVGRDLSKVSVGAEPLPPASSVAGRYVPLERQEGNLVDFAKYLNLYQVDAVGDHTIAMSIGGFQGIYVQTAPYVYELIGDNTPVFRNIYPVLRFRMEQDDVRHIIVGNGMDLTVLPPGRTRPFLISSVLIVVASGLYFLLAPFGLLIATLKNRGKPTDLAKKRFVRYHLLLLLLGAVTLLNNAAPVVKIMTCSFRTNVEMMPHVLLNYPLVAGAVTAAILAGRSLGSQLSTSRKERTLLFATSLLLLLLFATLMHWNFFALAG